MEHKETLQATALIGELPHPVEAKIHHFFANGVMATGIVVCGIFLACNELFLYLQISTNK
jgi:hypothetical protein